MIYLPSLRKWMTEQFRNNEKTLFKAAKKIVESHERICPEETGHIKREYFFIDTSYIN